MARRFNTTAANYLTITYAPVTAVPLTMACWFRCTSDSVTGIVMGLGNLGATNQNFYLAARGAVAGDPVSFACRNGGSASFADTTTGYSINKWHHACGVATSTTLRDVYIDGGSTGQNTTSLTPTGISGIRIGASASSNVPTIHTGEVAKAAIWNVALSIPEIRALAGGVDPIEIRRGNLVFYPELSWNAAVDLLTGKPIGHVNHPSVDFDPPVFLYERIFRYPPVAAPAAANNIRAAVYHHRHHNLAG